MELKTSSCSFSIYTNALFANNWEDNSWKLRAPLVLECILTKTVHWVLTTIIPGRFILNATDFHKKIYAQDDLKDELEASIEKKDFLKSYYIFIVISLLFIRRREHHRVIDRVTRNGKWADFSFSPHQA